MLVDKFSLTLRECLLVDRVKIITSYIILRNDKDSVFSKSSFLSISLMLLTMAEQFMIVQPANKPTCPGDEDKVHFADP